METEPKSNLANDNWLSEINARRNQKRGGGNSTQGSQYLQLYDCTHTTVIESSCPRWERLAKIINKQLTYQ